MLRNQAQAKHPQMNLGFNEAKHAGEIDLKNHPVFVVNYYSQQIRDKPLCENDRQNHLISTELPPKDHLNKNKNKKKKTKNKEETKLKSFYSERLIECIADEGISYQLAAHQLNMPFDKLMDLTKGNVGRVGFYELLKALTHFGYDARICMRSTNHKGPGAVMPDK